MVGRSPATFRYRWNEKNNKLDLKLKLKKLTMLTRFFMQNIYVIFNTLRGAQYILLNYLIKWHTMGKKTTHLNPGCRLNLNPGRRKESFKFKSTASDLVGRFIQVRTKKNSEGWSPTVSFLIWWPCAECSLKGSKFQRSAFGSLEWINVQQELNKEWPHL